jgi:hypothetical protein
MRSDHEKPLRENSTIDCHGGRYEKNREIFLRIPLFVYEKIPVKYEESTGKRPEHKQKSTIKLTKIVTR